MTTIAEAERLTNQPNYLSYPLSADKARSLARSCATMIPRLYLVEEKDPALQEAVAALQQAEVLLDIAYEHLAHLERVQIMREEALWIDSKAEPDALLAERALATFNSLREQKLSPKTDEVIGYWEGSYEVWSGQTVAVFPDGSALLHDLRAAKFTALNASQAAEYRAWLAG